jgi:transposase-like protein
MQLDFSEIFVYSEQPATCPKCGSRTEIILDLLYSKDQTQIHVCPKCEYEFVMQYDKEFEEYDRKVVSNKNVRD